MRHVNHRLFLMFFTITLTSCHGYSVQPPSDEDRALTRAALLLLIEKEDTAGARDIAGKLDPNHGNTALLMGWIYYHEKRYAIAADTVATLIPVYERSYRRHNESPILTRDHELERIYTEMLRLSGVANYQAKRCEKAVEYLSAYISEMREFHRARQTVGNPEYSMLGFCQYQLEDYSGAKETFRSLHDMLALGNEKDEAAFNVGALYARIGDIVESLRWLENPVSHKPAYWLGRLESDRDFDTIRHDEKFKLFVQKNLIKHQ